jgi:hypothetical protein
MRHEANGEHAFLGPSDTGIPLTATQEGMWFAERLNPGRSGYHDAVTLHLAGRLAPDALRKAFADCHRRHDALRGRVRQDGGELTQTFDAAAPPLHEHDLSGLAPERREAAGRRRFALDCTEPFDLGSGPLWRTRLLRLREHDHRLLIVMHHLMTDGWSHGVFLRTLLSRYAQHVSGASAGSSPAPTFADWARHRVEAENAPEIAGLARRAAVELHDVPRRVSLPGVNDVAGTRGGVLPLDLQAAEMAAFQAACARLRVSRFMALTGLLAHLISETARVPELMISAPVADRRTPESGRLLGCTINTIPVRFTAVVSPIEAVTGARDAVVSALRLLPVPYREVIRAAEQSFSTSLADPLTNLSCEEFSSPSGSWQVGDLTITALPRGEFQTRHDLTLSVPRDMAGRPELIYPLPRWDPAAIEQVGARLADLVRTVGRSAG